MEIVIASLFFHILSITDCSFTMFTANYLIYGYKKSLKTFISIIMS